ncbi:hypothetical protein E7Y35_01915 [Spiroplasma sp. SV19]|nr:hypothetical protein E7Y35_01915 [Spiroplasma sp. SV19]
MTAFFAANQTFEYTGEFFFKDKSLQTADETDRIQHGWASNIYDVLIDSTFGQKFNDYFTYLPNEYSFKLGNVKVYYKYTLNQTYEIKFMVIIKSNKNDIDFKQENLVLKFTETKQFAEQQWLDEYINYYIKLGDVMWTQKFSGFRPHLLDSPLALWNEQFPQKKYQENNNPEILKAISAHYVQAFSSETDSHAKWFYREKRIKAIANSFEYLGPIPVGRPEGVRVKANLTFSYLNNNKITATRDVELWMDYRHSYTIKW